MEIEGPLLISVMHDDQSMNRDLHIKFKQEFQDLALEQRSRLFSDYIKSLRENSLEITDDNDATKQGMMMILQLAQELLPHICNDEIPLNETINVSVESAVKVTNLLDTLSKH